MTSNLKAADIGSAAYAAGIEAQRQQGNYGSLIDEETLERSACPKEAFDLFLEEQDKQNDPNPRIMWQGRLVTYVPPQPR